ncbi:hypothetical protein GCM10028806_34710 [Spirosoma terrae]|uniref:Uncharacterized protein n=1 Tax=Spirosoma terrae TaxID=1968276 RepID=A0A6L9L5F3_9BACT|nr:hypothetical protein [Spirosoma terrae]NDU95786.1 hypothetical protein [Spirosoma terrae]
MKLFLLPLLLILFSLPTFAQTKIQWGKQSDTLFLPGRGDYHTPAPLNWPTTPLGMAPDTARELGVDYNEHEPLLIYSDKDVSWDPKLFQNEKKRQATINLKGSIITRRAAERASEEAELLFRLVMDQLMDRLPVLERDTLETLVQDLYNKTKQQALLIKIQYNLIRLYESK